MKKEASQPVSLTMLMSLTRAVDTALCVKGSKTELRKRLINQVIFQPRELGKCLSRIEMYMNVTFKSFTPRQ